MKFNWGKGLLLAMIIFISFIMFFVVKMSRSNKQNHDLVTEEYYKKDLAYQQEINAEENFEALAVDILGKRTQDGWLLTFPDTLDNIKINGKVFLYRPSNKQLDFDFPIVLSDSNLLIPDKRLIDGRWNITIVWEYLGKKYMYKKQILY